MAHGGYVIRTVFGPKLPPTLLARVDEVID
jgi:hypothetical protein